MFNKIDKQTQIIEAQNNSIILLSGHYKLLLEEHKQDHKELYSTAAKDKFGRTPADLVDLYFKSETNNDYVTMYNLTQLPEDISFERYKSERERESDSHRYMNYTIEDYLLCSHESSMVYITYEIEWDDRTDKLIWEPWACVKVNDEWKLRWLARQ